MAAFGPQIGGAVPVGSQQPYQGAGLEMARARRAERLAAQKLAGAQKAEAEAEKKRKTAETEKIKKAAALKQRAANRAARQALLESSMRFDGE